MASTQETRTCILLQMTTTQEEKLQRTTTKARLHKLITKWPVLIAAEMIVTMTVEGVTNAN